MSLDSVKDEIIHVAKVEAKKKIATAKKEVVQIVKDTQAKSVVLEAALKKELKEHEVFSRNKVDASVALEVKKLSFEKKKEVLETTFMKALEKVDAMDAAKRKTFLKALLAKAEGQMPFSVLYCNVKDSKLLGKGNYAITIDDSISGGIIVENKQGTVRLDYTFRTLFEQLRENALQDIAGLLFK